MQVLAEAFCLFLCIDEGLWPTPIFVLINPFRIVIQFEAINEAVLLLARAARFPSKVALLCRIDPVLLLFFRRFIKDRGCKGELFGDLCFRKTEVCDVEEANSRDGLF